MKDQRQSDAAAAEAAYRYYITKFADEMKDITKLSKLYTYAQALWLAESK